MKKYGFRNVSVHYIPINRTPDSSDIDEEFASLIFEVSRQVHLDSLSFLLDIAIGVVKEAEVQKWIDEINRKYDKRIRLAFAVSTTEYIRAFTSAPKTVSAKSQLALPTE